MAEDNNVIIEGQCKFREGKKWKSRWCVIRKLSPVAEWAQLEVRRADHGGAVVCAVTLVGLMGAVVEVPLDRHSHTLALVAKDHVSTLAFDTREQLLHWQVRIKSSLGESVWFPVEEVSAGGRGGRCAVRGGRAAVVGGAPLQLHHYWDLHRLRRFGVVKGRLVVEEGGRGEVTVLSSPRPVALHRALLFAAQHLSPTFTRNYKEYDMDSPKSNRMFRSESRLSELTSLDLPLRGDSKERDEDDDWSGEERPVGISRCRSCVSKLGAVSTPLTPGQFSPAWTLHEDLPVDVSNYVCPLRVPPPHPAPHLPTSRSHSKWDKVTRSQSFCICSPAPLPHNVGPYENYDVPKSISMEEYYDTPKRLKDNVNKKVFSITDRIPAETLALKKSCECVSRLGRGSRAGPRVVDVDEPGPAGACPCNRVTDWANSIIPLPDWANGIIPLPGCGRSTDSLARTEPDHKDDVSALYATVDMARKTRRGGVTRTRDRHGPPHAHYENLQFALSLEHYENARALLRTVGVTQSELDVLGAGPQPDYLLMRPAPPAPPAPQTSAWRDSSWSGDSGVSSPPPRPRSADPLTSCHQSAKLMSSSADSEVLIMKNSSTRGACSSSSGTSDLSDYIETLSLCSSHSSDPPLVHHTSHSTHTRDHRPSVSTLRPRSGNEYKSVNSSKLIQRLSDDVLIPSRPINLDCVTDAVTQCDTRQDVTT